jgi:hypothetical protein
MSDDAPLTGSERDLLRVAVRDSPDGFLMSLLSMARQGLHEHIGLLVNGMIIVGELNQPDVLAELLHVRRGSQIGRAERPEGLSDDEWDEMVQAWITEPSRVVEDLREREAALEDAVAPYAENGPPRSRDLPGELERQLEALGTHSHITLTSATITAPGMPTTTSVPIMRIAVRQISGWWLAPLNEDGSSSILLWDGEPRVFGDE